MKNNHYEAKGILKNKKTLTIDDSRGKYEVTDLSISTCRLVKGNKEIIMVPVEAWGEVSKSCANIDIGDMVIIEGYFKNKKWKNKSGIEVSKNLIVAEKVEKV